MQAAGVAAASAALRGVPTARGGLMAGGVGEMGARTSKGGVAQPTQLNILKSRFEALPLECPTVSMDELEVCVHRAVCVQGRGGTRLSCCAAPSRCLCLGRCSILSRFMDG